MPSTLTWKSLWQRLVFVVRAWRTSRRGTKLSWCDGCGAMLTHTPSYQIRCDDCMEEAEKIVKQHQPTPFEAHAAAMMNAASQQNPQYLAMLQGQQQSQAQQYGVFGAQNHPLSGLGGLFNNNPFWR